jgi:hypothetical protein
MPLTTPVPLDADLLCGHCSHNLRGVPSDHCPECGTPFDRSRILLPNIPWEQRRYLGHFRAYWATVRLITFRPAKIATDADAVTLRAARSFRRWTIALLLVTSIVPLILWRLQPQTLSISPNSPYEMPLVIPAPVLPELPDELRNGWFLGTSIFALALWLIAITGVVGYFFHPRRQSPARQKRGVALSYYALAPLAWVAPLGALAGLILWLMLHWTTPNWGFYAVAAVYGTIAVLCALAPIAWLWSTLRLLASSTDSHCRALIAAPLLPMLWILLAIGIFFGLQFLVNYVALFFASLR